MISKKIVSFFPKNPVQKSPEFAAIFLFAFATIELIALISFSFLFPEKNILGLFGHTTGTIWYFLFGPVAFLGISYLYLLSWNWWNKKYHSSTSVHIISYLGSLFSLSLLLRLLTALFPELNTSWNELIGISAPIQQIYPSAKYFPVSGFIADFLYIRMPYGNFQVLFNLIGTAFISSTTLFVSLILLFDINLKGFAQSFIHPTQDHEASPILQKTGNYYLENEKKREEIVASISKKEGITSHNRNKKPTDRNNEEYEPKFPLKNMKHLALEKTTPLPKKEYTEHENPTPYALNNYQLPSIDLLHFSEKIDQKDVQKELQERATLLEETLMSFGIEAKVGQIHCGPTVTLFEVHPAIGVKIGKIKTLENDIALNMEAKSIRIIAPIPGKAAVGIEIPNQSPQEVSFQELLHSYAEKKLSYKIPMLLGKAVNGEWIVTDLSKMPHCIIAGATGSGKSVCINSIVMSILMLANPDEIRLLMIDPKKVELTPYTNLPHMLAPVITEPHEAALSLNWLVREMEKRYEILKLLGLRNIDSFNKRTRNIEQESNLPLDIPEKLTYYVGIIDELADLMMVSSQDIETPIARIAQMARAVGIHLILATQRPSREVITGLIKANFPARISFKVASRVNSQIILDDTGAETLLGNGDMLLSLPGTSQLIRCQGVFVRDDEILKVIQAIESEHSTNYLIQSFQKLNESESSYHSDDETELDALYNDAKNVVFSTGNASTTFLQRKLKIGYARAASIMDQLEDRGIIGPQEGSKPRKIFFPKKMEDQIEQDDLQLAEEEHIEAFTSTDPINPIDNKNQERFYLLRDIATQSQRISEKESSSSSYLQPESE